jgi:photosystem II biogenesis protein Psp29
VNTLRTVSDTKRAFYNVHTRPINSIYRRVVEELMVEMHLLSVNVDFRYDPIYALGVVTTFDRFMQGYRPEQDQESIFRALCQAQEQNPDQYRQDASQLLAIASDSSWDRLISTSSDNQLGRSLSEIAANPKFKYSRLFVIGLFSLLEAANPDVIKDETKRVAAVKQICETLNLQQDKVEKDLDLYRSNLDKMVQAQAVMADMLEADRKKREERAKAKAVTETEGGTP